MFRSTNFQPSVATLATSSDEGPGESGGDSDDDLLALSYSSGELPDSIEAVGLLLLTESLLNGSSEIGFGAGEVLLDDGLLPGSLNEEDEPGDGLSGSLNEEDELGDGLLSGSLNDEDELGDGLLSGSLNDEDELGDGLLSGSLKEEDDSFGGGLLPGSLDEEDELLEDVGSGGLEELVLFDEDCCFSEFSSGDLSLFLILSAILSTNLPSPSFSNPLIAPLTGPTKLS